MMRRISGAVSPAWAAFFSLRTGTAAVQVAGMCLLWVIFVRITWPAAGQDAPPEDTKREVQLHVLTDSVAIGERFFLAVTARHDTSETASFPLPDNGEALAFGDVEALDAAMHERLLPDGMRVDSSVYLVTTFALDTARVAPIPVAFTAGGDVLVLRTDSTWIPVRSLVPEDAEDIRDLAPLVAFPRSVWWIVAGIALLLLLAAGIAWWIRWRRNRDDENETEIIPPIPPDQEAYDRLDALEKTDLSDRRNVPIFYDELSGLLRTYVARRLHVQALEMTTGETVAQLREQDMPDNQTISRFRNVLVACDYVKFADARPPARQGADLIGTSRSIIETMEMQACTVEEAAAAETAEINDTSSGLPERPAQPDAPKTDTPDTDQSDTP